MGQHQGRRILGRALAVGAIMATSTVAGLASAAVRTRTCGLTPPPPGYPIRVRASTNVSCRQARRVVDVAYRVNGQRTQCTHRHTCTVQGFRCVFSGHGPEFGHVRCTNARRRLIIGGNR
jgi:hypothetical protein